MQNNEKTVEVLNDLVMINNDRIAGYDRAISEAKDLDVDLKATFEGMIHQSQEYKHELTDKMKACGAAPDDSTTTSGKIYRAWMDVKATFTGSDRKTILASCEFGEDAAQRAYQAAMGADTEMDPATRSLIAEQQRELKNSHDLIKKYRDAQDAISRH